MAKRIRLNEADIQASLESMKQRLETLKIAEGKLAINMSLPEFKAETNVYITGEAYMKIMYLVNTMDKEIAWHGTAERIEDGYRINDVFVYPQVVSGATVNTDQEEYEKWLYGLSEEQFNNNRFQGHSHVNMNVGPSSVDLEHQRKLLADLTDEMFYIFMIINKKGDLNMRVYDLAKNILFEPEDIELVVEDDNVMEFINSIEEMVKTSTYQNRNVSRGKSTYGWNSYNAKKPKENKYTKAYELEDYYSKYANDDLEDEPDYPEYGYGYGPFEAWGN